MTHGTIPFLASVALILGLVLLVTSPVSGSSAQGLDSISATMSPRGST
jgi:hypothetical protein